MNLVVPFSSFGNTHFQKRKRYCALTTFDIRNTSLSVWTAHDFVVLTAGMVVLMVISLRGFGNRNGFLNLDLPVCYFKS